MAKKGEQEPDKAALVPVERGALAGVPKTQNTLKTLLDRPDVLEAIRSVAPRHLTPERLLKMVLLASSREPKLLQCTTMSLIKAAMVSGELGLDCSGTLGMAYLVPFWNNKTNPSQLEAQFMYGYRGMMELAQRGDPNISYISAETVHMDDIFETEDGTNPYIRHKRISVAAPTKDNTQAAYAVAHFKDGTKQGKVMYTEEIEQIRAMSKAPTSLMWKSRWGEGAKKTVVRQLAKYLRMSPELAKVFEYDQDVDLEPSIVPLKDTNGRQKVEGLKDIFPVETDAGGEIIDDADYREVEPEGDGQSAADFILNGSKPE